MLGDADAVETDIEPRTGLGKVTKNIVSRRWIKHIIPSGVAGIAAGIDLFQEVYLDVGPHPDRFGKRAGHIAVRWRRR